MNRRHFLQQTTAAVATAALSPSLSTTAKAAPEVFAATGKPRFQFSVKWGMIGEPLSVMDKFKLLKDLGYDGVEMDSQYAVPAKELTAAIEATGIPAQGVVNANHWSTRLSDPSADIRAKALQELLDGIRYTHDIGASSLLLVPGAVRDPQNENSQQVWERSIAGIRQALPLAAEKGVRIGIENVWNQFLYQHGNDAPADQKPDQYIKYVDEIASTWVGIYLDLSNHRKYSYCPDWIHAMGSRIIKIDTKDYLLAKDAKDGRKEGFCDIGDGSVDWEATRKALVDINYFGWISSEVAGGNRARLADNLERMKKYIQGA
ncbi:MAG: putative L-xylulose 5-phosphate 3-epimerase [Verrucomicrobiales bacterium]|nr:putative L-xylulose 5-phosphate 3-epimerase [Verrucomicrobiales bacterium]